MSKWKEVSLGEVVVINAKNTSKDYDEKISYVDISSVGNGILKSYTEYEYKEAPSRARRIVRDEDIIYSTVRPNLKAFYKFGKNIPKNIIASTGFVVLSKKEVASIDYIYYFMITQSFIDHLSQIAKGAAYPAVGVDDFKQLKFQIPDLETQEKIADILSTYDELIENNNKRIEILEKTAEEIYKEWFVRMRFPGYKNTKFIKGIPEGWEVKRVGDLLNRLQAGHFYKEDELLEEGEVIVIDQSVKEHMGFHNEEPTHMADIENPIVLFGDHSCKMLIMTRKFSLGENVVPFISNYNHPVLFLYYSLKGLIQTEEYKRHWKELINKKIFYPKIWLQEKFRDTIKDNINLIEKYKEQNQNLIKQRDLLLPRLMNGTIEVK